MNITSKQVAIGAGIAGIVFLAYFLFRNKLKGVSRTAEEGGGGGSGGGGGVFSGGLATIPVVTVPVATVPVATVPHTNLPPNPIYAQYKPTRTGLSKTPEMAHKASGDEYYMDLVSTQGGNDGFSF